jgi:alpha-glucosidase
VKIDFFESDKQATIQLYLDILEDAAASKLMVDFHGSTLPRGWERTYPNLMSSEGVRGAEMYQFDAAFAQYTPTHNAMLVFTRNVVGPMDYTPVTFSYARNRHHTTWGHELALSVVFESGLQHFADSPQSYLALPAEVKGFLSGVPAAWDETRLLEGEPGKLAVLARRRGRDWYVAGINGEASVKRVTLPLDLLGNGTYDMLLAADGRTESSFLITRRQRNGTDAQAVELAPYGGFALRLVPLN